MSSPRTFIIFFNIVLLLALANCCMAQTNIALEDAIHKLGGPLSYQHFQGESDESHAS